MFYPYTFRTDAIATLASLEMELHATSMNAAAGLPPCRRDTR